LFNYNTEEENLTLPNFGGQPVGGGQNSESEILSDEIKPSSVAGTEPSSIDGIKLGSEENRMRRACHKAHSATRKSYIEAWKGGSLLKIHRENEKEGESFGGGKRGPITVFNWETKARILQTLAQLEKSWLPAYTVLTFPDEYYSQRFTGERTVQILDAFLNRFRRAYPQRGAFWRREHELRKSGLHVGESFPHFNFLVWGVGVDELRQWMRVNWWETCGKLSEAHLKACDKTQQVYSWKAMVFYVSKYVAKKDKNYFAEPGWGHWWGLVNSNYLPWVKPVTVEVSKEQATKLLRYAKRRVKGKRNINTRLVTNCNPDFWIERLGDILELGIDGNQKV
jgi:hypothetical protein